MSRTRTNPLLDWRRRAAAAFRRLPDPDFRYGLGLGLSAADIRLPYRRPAKRARPTPATVGNGEQIKVLTGQEVGAGLARSLAGLVPASYDQRLAAWLDAQAVDSLILVVPAGRRIAKPIYLDRRPAAGLNLDKTVVVAGPDSRVTLVERVAGRAQRPSVRTAALDILVGRQAQVTAVTVDSTTARTDSHLFRRARVLAGGRLTWSECLLRGAHLASSLSVELAGRAAALRTRSVIFGGADQRFDLWHRVRHGAAATISDCLTRAALTGSAKAVCRGRLEAVRSLDGCHGRQRMGTLLFSPRAKADLLPEIETASAGAGFAHAAAVGHPDRDRLFYLMSRGLDQQTAVRLLVEAYLSPVLEDLKDIFLEEAVRCLIASRLDSFHPDDIINRH